VNACLKQAKSKVVGGTIHSAGRDGSHRVYHVTQGRRQAFVFLPTARGGSCIVKSIGRASARTWGHFAKGQGKLKAYLLSARCKEGCGPAVLAIRNAQKKTITAKRLRGTCTQGGTLEALTLFGREAQTLMLRCRAGSGGFDYIETAALYQLRGGQLRHLLSVPMGSGVTWSKGKQTCTSRAPGWVKAGRVGASPTVNALALEDQDGVGRVDAEKVSYRYDSTRKRFVRAGATKTKVQVRQVCQAKSSKTSPRRSVLAKPITITFENGEPGVNRQCVGVGSKGLYKLEIEDVPDSGGMSPDQAYFSATLYRYSLRNGYKSSTKLAHAKGMHRWDKARRQLKKSIRSLNRRIKREKMKPCQRAEPVIKTSKLLAHHKDAVGAFRASHPTPSGRVFVTVFWTEKHVYVKSSRAPKKVKRVGELVSTEVAVEDEDQDSNPPEFETVYQEPANLIYLPGTGLHILLYSGASSEATIIRFTP